MVHTSEDFTQICTKQKFNLSIKTCVIHQVENSICVGFTASYKTHNYFIHRSHRTLLLAPLSYLVYLYQHSKYSKIISQSINSLTFFLGACPYISRMVYPCMLNNGGFRGCMGAEAAPPKFYCMLAKRYIVEATLHV